MRYFETSSKSFAERVSARRRGLLGAFGASALGAALLGGCATPPTLPPRPVDPAVAPRVGDTWLYQYTSVFRSVPPRRLEVRLLEVGPAGLRDRMAAEGAGGGEDHLFTSALEMVERPLAGISYFELSPYLQAFGALPAEATVAAPTPSWGAPFAGRARLKGTEHVTVPGGSFEAVRMDIEISRTPGSTLQPRIDPVFTLATVWYAPGPKRAVQWRLVTRAGALNVLVDDTYQLASYRPA
jgi:hypothetical protein